jgi:MFS family permease
MIGSAYFIGWASSLLFIPTLADIYGRKWIYRICLIIYMVDITMIYFVTTAKQMIAIQFVNGFVTTARLSIGFVYAQELCSKKH